MSYTGGKVFNVNITCRLELYSMTVANWIVLFFFLFQILVTLRCRRKHHDRYNNGSGFKVLGRVESSKQA
jgi:hypothetical protein